MLIFSIMTNLFIFILIKIIRCKKVKKILQEVLNSFYFAYYVRFMLESSLEFILNAL